MEDNNQGCPSSGRRASIVRKVLAGQRVLLRKSFGRGTPYAASDADTGILPAGINIHFSSKVSNTMRTLKDNPLDSCNRVKRVTDVSGGGEGS